MAFLMQPTSVLHITSSIQFKRQRVSENEERPGGSIDNLLCYIDMIFILALNALTFSDNLLCT
jgi:hypothetical protein